MKVIAFDDQKGGWSIHKPSYNDELRFINFPNDTDEAKIARAIAKVVPKVNGVHVDHFVYESTTHAPQDKIFRFVWKRDGDKMVVDIPKARIVHMDRIRKVRNWELIKQSGSKDRQPPEIEATFTPERQTLLQSLRDIPQDFDLIGFKTPETLDAAWPTALLGDWEHYPDLKRK